MVVVSSKNSSDSMLAWWQKLLLRLRGDVVGRTDSASTEEALLGERIFTRNIGRTIDYLSMHTLQRGREEKERGVRIEISLC